MEYEKIKFFLDNASNQRPKFEIKSRVEINAVSRVTYSKDYQIRFKTKFKGL